MCDPTVNVNVKEITDFLFDRAHFETRALPVLSGQFIMPCFWARSPGAGKTKIEVSGNASKAGFLLITSLGTVQHTFLQVKRSSSSCNVWNLHFLGLKPLLLIR